MYLFHDLLRDCLLILRLMLSELERINQLLFPLKPTFLWNIIVGQKIFKSLNLKIFKF